MTNELIFTFHVGTISLSTLLFCRLGKEALIAYVSLLFVIANIFVIKQINLFGWCVTSADAFIVGISLSINLLQEFWGQQYARKAIWLSFACSIFYMITTQFILQYTPSTADSSHVHFTNIMAFTIRIICASFISYLITQFADIHLYGYVKKQTDGKYFIFRNYFALMCSQLLDTILFSYLGLYGIVENIGHIITMSYGIKIIAIVMTTPFLMIAKKAVIKKSALS